MSFETAYQERRNSLLVKTASYDSSWQLSRVHGRTAVQSAAEAGHEEILELLLTARASPDEPACPFGGRTALAAAAGAGHEGICRMLLACGADPDAPASTSRGVMALQAAASGGL